MLLHAVSVDVVSVDIAPRPPLALPSHRYREGLDGFHSVTISGRACIGVIWVSDTRGLCEPTGQFIVGLQNVSVVVGGDPSPSFPLMALCPPDYFGAVGEECSPCPTGASCAGGYADPVSLNGCVAVSVLS